MYYNVKISGKLYQYNDDGHTAQFDFVRKIDTVYNDVTAVSPNHAVMLVFETILGTVPEIEEGADSGDDPLTVFNSDRTLCFVPDFTEGQDVDIASMATAVSEAAIMRLAGISPLL